MTGQRYDRADRLGFHLVELDGNSHEFGADGELRFLTAILDHAATDIALVQKPPLIAPALAGSLALPFDTGIATYDSEKSRYTDKGLDRLLLAHAHRTAAREDGMPPPAETAAMTAEDVQAGDRLLAADVACPSIEIGGEWLDLGSHGRARFVTVTMNRAGAVVVALVAGPGQSTVAPEGYYAWALAGERRTQTVVRHDGYRGAGLGPAMWAYACRSAELVEWIGHPQHDAKRTDKGQSFALRVGGDNCIRCGERVDLPPWERQNPAATVEMLEAMFDPNKADQPPTG